ncbi:putative peptidase [bioreactor metagenome]|uniref:Putative peptidase n=1 Tax=bioreactor metagenome TaxID=1076179 RepID=A0A644ZQ19_9ZZZZ|nr:Xaa-Pro peptidase family protein [Erysipelotrichaceae bacterium]
MNDRINRLQQMMLREGYDHFIISDYYNIFYLTGLKIHAGERLLVLLLSSKKQPILIVNRLFPISESPEYVLSYYDDTDKPLNLLTDYLDGAKIAVDKTWRSGFLIGLMQLYPALYDNGSIMIDELRAIKDPYEQELLIKSSMNNDLIMQRIVPFLQTGVSEAEVAGQLKQYYREINGNDESFEAIVAFGENGANPHAKPSDRQLRAGDSIVIDMGGPYHGYYSDMTRTFFCQRNEMEEVYETVLKANLAAIEIIKPGVTFARIDQAARTIIDEAGYGSYFTHRTGHGIGMEVHEPYDVSAVNQRCVEAGMCFSIEPGIYLPGKGGVRIEDLVLVSAEGVKVLNQYPKKVYITK